MIKLKVVRWKNFLATGNQFLEVNLDKEPMTLIVGKNGAGKSTLIDAITFSLFGKPFKKINKGQLMNCLLYTSPSPRDAHESRMPSSA